MSYPYNLYHRGACCAPKKPKSCCEPDPCCRPTQYNGMHVIYTGGSLPEAGVTYGETFNQVAQKLYNYTLGVSKGGSSTFSGDNTETSFVVTHGFGKVPEQVSVTLTSAININYYISNRTTTTFTVTFFSAVPTGVNNLSFDWILK